MVFFLEQEWFCPIHFWFEFQCLAHKSNQHWALFRSRLPDWAAGPKFMEEVLSRYLDHVTSLIPCKYLDALKVTGRRYRVPNNCRVSVNELCCFWQSLWWGKLGRQGAICWLKKEVSLVHGIFFRNKTFLFLNIEIWNFQHLFDLLFRET